MRPLSEYSSVIELLDSRAQLFPADILYTFLPDGENQTRHLTAAAVVEQSRAIAARLHRSAQPGDRALLVFQPGLEFITAFFACLRAGIIAVPAFPPRNARNVPRLRSIAQDAAATICLTSSSILGRSQELLNLVPGLERLLWIATDEIASEASNPETSPIIGGDSLAYLQYTSGSTNSPKGVMITHGNVLHNLEFICDQCNDSERHRIVSWVPFFHDMGLIYGILQPLCGNSQGILMPPNAFLQRPSRWLEALSRFRADSSVAPNFAYDLCVERISESEKKLLDLSCWSRAHNAAEPVRPATLERFAAAFAGCGVRQEILKPGYGLAEATLAVTFTRQGNLYQTKKVSKAELARHRIADPFSDADAQSLAGCGRTAPNQTIFIVDPKTLAVCSETAVGEIWISGPSVAQGYWNRPEETCEAFRAFTADGQGPFLRTGDLGFLQAGELYVTGRVKDMIIIRGVNYYPQDIEITAQQSHPALQPEAGAAFAIDVQGEEQLVIVHEIVRHNKADLGEVSAALRTAVVETHGIEAYSVMLIRPNSIPKTTSGKIQRSGARKLFLAGELKVEHAWRSGLAAGSLESFKTREAQSEDKSTERHLPIEHWLRTRLSQLLHIGPAEFDARQPFSSYGLDSMRATLLAGELEEKLGRAFPPSLLFDYPSIERLVSFLETPGPPPRSTPIREAPRVQEEIAIIGLGCRFPGAANPHEFWNLLSKGVDAISEIPPDRWDVDSFYEPKAGVPGKMNTRWGGFLKNVSNFAADFFEISPREAIQMDPQQRLLLEVSWEALEHAGIPAMQLAGSHTGVFVGISSFDYSLLQLQDPATLNAYVGTGMAHSIAANRISYFLDLRGPSMAVDTACSSSLVAVHQARESLLRGECELALAGGVNLMLKPELTIALSQAHMMASDGRCKTFDARADGYVRSEGCGIVVLKRLSKALSDGDSILAVIAGSAVNQDGHSNGLTAPNGPAQESVVRAALASANVSAREISFIECHGTGTSLGDPQEVEALHHVLGAAGSREQACWIGSVKTNIGHLEAASGIAGLMKVVLSLQHRQIPPHLHLQTVNPLLRLEQTSFKIPRELTAWECAGRRIAGTSSFGFGGTNAHLILAEVTETKPGADSITRPQHLLTLSARTPEALLRYASNLRDFLAAPSAPVFEDICFTANSGRSLFENRLALVAESAERAAEQLRAFASGKTPENTYHGSVEPNTRSKLVFLFTGQGSQYPAMGRRLYESHPTFRNILQQCDEILREPLGESLLGLLYDKRKASEKLDRTRYAQPVLFAIEFALAELWRSWGVVPDAVMGHGAGEYAAACVAGVFSLEDGLRLMAMRAKLIDSLPADGQMAAVFASAAEVRKAIASYMDHVAIAAVNGPAITVISGKKPCLRQVLSNLDSDGVAYQLMTVSHAFHSPSMEPILKEFERASRKIAYRAPAIPLISSLTGRLFDRDIAPDATYWTRHIREAVQFAGAIVTLLDEGATHFLECGPAPTLLGMAKRNVSSPEAYPRPIAWLPSLKQSVDDWQVLLKSLAQLFVSGRRIDWKAFDQPYSRCKIPLPTYPFERSSYWIPSPSRSAATAAQTESEAWNEVIEAGNRAAEDSRWIAQSETERRRLDCLNELSRVYVLQTFDQLGAPLLEVQNGSPDPLIERLQRRGRSASLIPMWWRAVRQIAADTIAPSRTVDAIWRETTEIWSGETFVPELVRRCGERLRDVVLETVDPRTLLFPDGDFSLLERLYRDAATARHCNSVLATLACRLISHHKNDAPLRILELGAGTGGTTAHLLSAFAQMNVIYTFTDIGPAFVQSAKERFKEFSFVRYSVLDLERAPASQGFQPNSFDLIIAANVLHATASLRQTLQHVRSLLSPGGHLLIWEATRPQLWLDITFGLLEGWHRFEDRDVRPEHPLLGAKAWLDMLDAAGFRRARAFPSTDQNLGQHILIAQDTDRNTAHVSDSSPGWDAHAGRERPGHFAKLFYEIEWRQSVTIAPEKKNNTSTSFWLVFADGSDGAKRLTKFIENSGDRVVLVRPGNSYRHDGKGKFQLRPGERDDFQKLFADLSREAVSRILYLWDFDSAMSDNPSPTFLKKTQLRGIQSVVPLIQQLATHNAGVPDRNSFWMITRHVHDAPTSPGAADNMMASTLWGLAKVIALEQPNLWGGIADLGSVTDAEISTLLQIIKSPGVEREFAVRDNVCFVPRLRTAASSLPHEPIHFAGDATYLITGGLGGMGLSVARWMIERGAKRLILMGRSKLPPRREWKKKIRLNDPIAPIVSAIFEMEALGASIHPASVDVADHRQLAAFLTQFQDDGWPAIRGVIHAAGVLDDHTLARLDARAIEAVMRPKVIGAFNLHSLLEKAPLDFFVLFSSVAAVLGSPGQANHAAANAFLDSLARWRRKRSLPAQTINWGPWAKVGAAVRHSDPARLALLGVRFLSPDDGLAALEATMLSDRVQTIVVDLDTDSLSPDHIQERPLLSGLAGNAAARLEINKNLPDSPTAEMATASDPVSVIAKLQQAAAALLMQEAARLPLTKPLNQLGFDSLMAVQLQNEIELHFSCALPLDEITQSSISDLAKRVSHEPTAQKFL